MFLYLNKLSMSGRNETGAMYLNKPSMFGSNETGAMYLNKPSMSVSNDTDVSIPEQTLNVWEQ